MTKKFSLTWFFLTLILLSSCSESLPIREERQSLTLQFFEQDLKSNNNVDRQFHVAAAANLQVPGYIIGVEKAGKNVVGFSKANLSSTAEDHEELNPYWSVCGAFAEDKNYYISENNNNGTRKELVKLLSENDEVTFVSHINKYSYSKFNDPTSNVINEYIYNTYSCTLDADLPICQHLDFRKRNLLRLCVYNSGWKSLIELQSNLQNDLNEASKKQKPISHIIVYAMGWNTVQRAAIQNFNFLQGNLIKLAKADKKFKDFNPLMIGITWPSDWALEDDRDNADDLFYRPLKRALSFFSKRHEADEVGSMWGNILLQKTLLPLKEKNPDLKIVLVGHSFGTRIITNSIFSEPMMMDKSQASKEKVDLLIGLQGAFPITRFIKDDIDYSYQNTKEKVAKMVYSWSNYDSANNIVSGYIGGSDAYEKFAVKYPEIFELAATDSCGLVVDKNKLTKSDFEDECFSDADKYISNRRNNKILYVDSSKIINHQNEKGSGGAHSDLYHDGVTKFILNNIYDFTIKK